MNFFSIEFLILFLSTALLIFILQLFEKKISPTLHSTLSKIVLIAASIVFIGTVDVRACFVVAIVTLTVYAVTHRFVRTGFRFAKAIGIIIALSGLVVFKYFDFFIGSFCNLFNLPSPGALILYIPLGVSYFTFSAISCICDITAEKLDRELSFIDIALYLLFFPKFLAGPIVKAADFAKQLQKPCIISLGGIEQGVQMFLLGLFKKVVIANHVGQFVDGIFSSPAAFDTPTLWLAVISYTLQLYFDFSGYSDMAIGCAAVFGFKFERNFNNPLAAGSIQDFWRRWHISLSTWFRDYVYIPLGGNRKGKLRTGINKIIVFLLTGLWHGANWTFVCWGLIHGFFILLETYNIITPKKWRLKPLRHIYTMLVVVLAFTFFRASSFSGALDIIKGLFVWQEGISQPYFWSFAAIILLAASLVAVYLHNRKNSAQASGEALMTAFYPCLNLSKFGSLIIFWTVVLLIAVLAYTGASPFVYAQF